MATARYVSPTRHLYPTDLLSMALALLFATVSFLNIGKLSISLFGARLDREALYGIVFLILVPGLPLFYRVTNGVKNLILQFFRLFYPQILYLLFYQQAIILSQLFYNGRSFDAVFARADRMIFTFQPSIRFHELFTGQAGMNELFFFGYFSFFVLMTAGWWVLYAKGEVRAAVSTFSIVTLSFYILYLFYSVFPVEGPKYYFPALHHEWYNHFRGYLFTTIMRYLFNNVDLSGAAFPSSHVIIASLSLLLNFRHNRRLAIAFAPITLILYFSTVYIYAHYAVDVFAGLLLVPLFWWGVPRLLRRLSRAFVLCDLFLARVYRLPNLVTIEIMSRSGMERGSSREG